MQAFTMRSAFALSLAIAFCASTHAQNQLPNLRLAQETNDSASHVETRLKQAISLDLRDATLLEALFSIRDLSGLNIVVGNEVEGTVNASFSKTPVDQILDTLLIPRGYSYRVVSGSLAILPLQVIGDKLPNFETMVVPLEANSSADLQPIVQALLSPEGRVHAVPSSNSLLVMDYRSRLDDAKKQIEALESAAKARALTQPLTPNGAAAAVGADGAPGAATGLQEAQLRARAVVKVFEPQFVLPSQIAQGITPLLSTIGTLAALENDDKVVVSDLPENIARIEQAVTQIDIPRPQVRIWALIYDAGIEDLEACGVNFQSGINGSAVAASGQAAQSIVMNSVTAPVGGPTNGVLTLSTINRLGSMQSVIQALDTSNDSRLLADPNVVVMDHEQAQIEIVTEVPYQVLTQGIDGGQIGTTEFREAGVTLMVTPHIAGDDTIAMQVNPRFSLLTGFTEGDNAPIIDRRETNTTVRIANLETLVLGGLRQRTRIVEKSGIPGLSKVPYLGHLFKFDRRTARESELIVFITPEIVTPHYRGNAREECIRSNVQTEIELTPTSPIPFGMDVLRAEKAAANARLNTFRPNECGCGQCANCYADPGIIGGYGVEHRK